MERNDLFSLKRQKERRAETIIFHILLASYHVYTVTSRSLRGNVASGIVRFYRHESSNLEFGACKPDPRVRPEGFREDSRTREYGFPYTFDIVLCHCFPSGPSSLSFLLYPLPLSTYDEAGNGLNFLM